MPPVPMAGTLPGGFLQHRPPAGSAIGSAASRQAQRLCQPAGSLSLATTPSAHGAGRNQRSTAMCSSSGLGKNVGQLEKRFSAGGKRQLCGFSEKGRALSKPLVVRVMAETTKVAMEALDQKEREKTTMAEEKGPIAPKDLGGEGGGGGGKAGTEVMRHQGGEKDKPKLIAYDYGFQAAFLRGSPTVPSNVLKLAFENFGREWKALRRNYLFVELSDVRKDRIERGPVATVAAYTGRAFVVIIRFLDRFLTLYDGLPEIKPQKDVDEEEVVALREKLNRLTLSNKAVWDREYARERVEAPWIILGPYYVLCLMLDVIFNNRPIQRFWFLETVARMPYFSYISMLHLYETLGWWRVGAEVRKVHFAEEWNEMQHLRIMESLGGDRLWIDRFFGQHAAFFYYWILNGLFLVSPKIAYNFSELIEMHAVDTYGTFVDENQELLKQLPPSPVAISYYLGDDLYMFDEFQTSRLPESRRPPINNLYDVFSAIRDDESEHVKTMAACQELETAVESPNRRRSKKARNGGRQEAIE